VDVDLLRMVLPYIRGEISSRGTLRVAWRWER
jgi:hypothetical protein